MAGGRVRGGKNRGNRKGNSTIASDKDGVPQMLHCRRTSKWRVKIPTPHTPQFVFLHLFLCSQQYCPSQDFTISLSLSSSGLCLCLAHRHSWILLAKGNRLAYCDGRIRKARSLCVHNTSKHNIARALRGLVVTETYTFSQSPATVSIRVRHTPDESVHYVRRPADVGFRRGRCNL